ncbi:MAG: hypothetical protein LUB59_02050 [Candidatus Gastranaerophilales bacterium]|nr:hypothetical protein [Candidatus Gastranaerophilales bacterium]
MTPINFTANYLKTVYIPKKAANDSYKHTEASIVELDIKDKNDVESLAKTAFIWEKTVSSYAFDIYNEALKEKIHPDVVAEHYYALTAQNSDYAHLKPEKILGLAMLSEKSEPKNELNWLQVNPKTNKINSSDRKYKYVGYNLVEYIKSISDKPIILDADYNAIDFYTKLGFSAKNPETPSIMIWHR